MLSWIFCHILLSHLTLFTKRWWSHYTLICSVEVHSALVARSRYVVVCMQCKIARSSGKMILHIAPVMLAQVVVLVWVSIHKMRVLHFGRKFPQSGRIVKCVYLVSVYVRMHLRCGLYMKSRLRSLCPASDSQMNLFFRLLYGCFFRLYWPMRGSWEKPWRTHTHKTSALTRHY